MSAEVQGLLKFVANGDPAGMLARVLAMVGELAALGVTPRVVVTVDLASTSRSSSSPISAATGTPGRGVAVTLTSPDPMPRSAEVRSGDDGGERGETASDVSMSAGEDFLGGAEEQGANVKRQASWVDDQGGIDWGVTGLTSLANQARLGLNGFDTTWRKVAKRIRLELVQAVLAQPTESGKAMTMGEFDRVKPAWMPAASSLPTTFGCSWSELPALRLSE